MQIVPIVSLELEKVSRRLLDRKLTLQVTDNAKQWLAQIGYINSLCSCLVVSFSLSSIIAPCDLPIFVRYDPSYGARPLKRTIQREIETPVAKIILSGKAKENSVLLIDKSSSEDTVVITVVPQSDKAKVDDGKILQEDDNVMQ